MDVRARIADLETGEPTQAMRVFDADEAPRAGSRARPRPAPRRVPREPPAPPATPPAREPREPPAAAEPEGPVPPPRTDDVLWSDDQPASSPPWDDDEGVAPWRRGLRG